jgi:transcriptional regulator with XRE-family HTH domain
MAQFAYRVGMGLGRHRDPRRAYLTAFGRNLKVQRVSRGLSQEQFGALIGLNRTFVGQLERGQRGINIVELPGIARALGVRQADLLPEPVDDPAAASDDPDLQSIGRSSAHLQASRRGPPAGAKAASAVLTVASPERAVNSDMGE